MTATLTGAMPSLLTVARVAEIEGVTRQTVREWVWQWNTSGGRVGLRRRGARSKAGIWFEDYCRFAARRGTLPERWAGFARERGWL
jgi:hypothetical protein